MRSIIIAALLGFISADDTMHVWKLRSVQDHHEDQAVQKHYGDHSIEQANARPPYRSHAQAEKAFVEVSDSDSDSSDSEEENVMTGDYYQPWQSGQFKDGYSRDLPARFSADSDDLFMRSMIATYAVEAKACDDDGANCKPTGAFWINEAGAKAAASEVLATHKGITGAELKAYLATYFAKAWGHFDVNRVGVIEVGKMPQFMRFLASDQRMQLGESL